MFNNSRLLFSFERFSHEFPIIFQCERCFKVDSTIPPNTPLYHKKTKNTFETCISLSKAKFGYLTVFNNSQREVFRCISIRRSKWRGHLQHIGYCRIEELEAEKNQK